MTLDVKIGRRIHLDKDICAVIIYGMFALITTITVFAYLLFILISWMHGNAEHTVQMIKNIKL